MKVSAMLYKCTYCVVGQICFICLVYSLVLYHFTDIEAPTVICPTNQTLESDPNQPTAVVVWTSPVATDNSNLIPTFSCSKHNGSQFKIGETKVDCQAIDKVGNPAICSFNVVFKGKW